MPTRHSPPDLPSVLFSRVTKRAHYSCQAITDPASAFASIRAKAKAVISWKRLSCFVQHGGMTCWGVQA